MAIAVLVHEWVTGGGLAGSPLPGSWAVEGGAMRRAIARDFASIPGVRVAMTLDDRLPDQPGPWTVYRLGPGQEAGQFPQLAALADFTVLIAPETGGILADRARAMEQAGARSLGSAPAAIILTANKLLTGMLLAGQGIATPECRGIIPAIGFPEDCSYPAVLKPIDGAGSLDTFEISGPGMVPEDAKGMSPALLQPLVPGTPMSASFLVGRAGARLIGVGQQRIQRRDGRFVYRGGTLPAPRECIDDAPRLAVESVSGLQGFVGVDFIWDEARKRACVLEINPRPTTSYVGLVRLLPPGMLAQAWINAVEGKPNAEAQDLAEMVHSQAPLTFSADGTIQQRRNDAWP